MGVPFEVGIDEIHRLVQNLEVLVEVDRLEIWGYDFGATIEGQCDQVRALLQRQTDERFHHSDGPDPPFLHRLQSDLWCADMRRHHLVFRNRALEQAYRGIMRSGKIIDTDRDASEIARRLQLGSNETIAWAAVAGRSAAILPRPVPRSRRSIPPHSQTLKLSAAPRFKQSLFLTLQYIFLQLVVVGVLHGVIDIETDLGKQPMFERHEYRKIEHRRIG